MKSLQDLRFIPKSSPFLQIPTTHLPNSLPIPISTLKTSPPPKIPTPHSPKPNQNLLPTRKFSSFSNFLTTHLPNSLKIHFATQKTPSFFDFPATHFALMAVLSFPLPSFAAETEQISDKINIESIIISIDDFFNRYPFFVAGVTFIWLVVIPLTQEYLTKYKFISAIDAFRKLRDEPTSQLLDIRRKQSVKFLNSPNLKILNKNVVHVEFVEGEEDGFVKEVLKRYGDPGNTILCVLDNFDGNSLKVAELLFKNGFKEAYAIKGGLRGKDGWQAIQETLLPPSLHVYPRKKKSKSLVQFEEITDGIDEQKSGNGQVPTSTINREEKHNMETDTEAKLANGRPLSPYPKYPDLKPPSSPAPSKPQS